MTDPKTSPASDQDKVHGTPDVSPDETIQDAMQGADGNEDANGLSPDPAVRQEKLEEVQENLKDLG